MPLASPRLFGSARLSPAQAMAVARPVTFPTNPTNPNNPLNCKVLIALGADLTQPWYTWPWTDVSQWVRFEAGISTSQGRPDWTSTTRTSSGQLTFDNRDGRFSRRNPNGPYYGLLTFNTPIWGTLDPGSGVVSRLQQFVNEWPTRWDITGNDSTVPIQTAGVMRRLGQAPALKSAPRRYLPGTAPVAYWPLEDGKLVSSGAPDVGAYSMTPFTGTHPSGAVITYPQWGSGTLAPWLPSVASRTGSAGLTILSAQVSMPAFTNTWTVDYYYASGSDAGVTALDINPSYLPGGALGWPQLILTPGSFLLQTAFNGEPETDSTVASLFDGRLHHIRLTATQSSTQVSWAAYLDGAAVNTGTTAGAMTLLPVSYIGLTADSQSGASVAQGHVAVWTSPPSVTTAALVAQGYAGEDARTRMTRLCLEEGMPFVCAGGASVAMGPQGVDQLLALLRDAEKADQGLLYEVAWGLAYQTVAERTNAPVSLALDFDRRHIAVPPEPADDDQRLRNRWTVNRPDGAEVVLERTSGPLGTQAGGPGVYSDQDTVNVYLDTQLADQAGWRRALGTVDEDRWPSIAIRLHATPDLIPSWVAMPFGGRLTAADPPSQVAPDTIDAVLEGWSERWDPFTWVVDLNTSPYSPYRIGTLAADVGDTAETTLVLIPDSLSLAADVGPADATWLVTSSPLWTTAAESFPRNIMWEGEVVQLTNCTGAAAPQTWTVVRSVNGVTKSHYANSTLQAYRGVYRPGRLALSG